MLYGTHASSISLLSGFLYDDVGESAAAVWGLRRLVDGYSGNLVRVRRSNDDAESDFGLDSNGVLDTSALLSWVGSNDGFVVNWYDQSGNGYTLSTEGITYQPRIVSAGFMDTLNNTNNDPCIYFNGSSSFPQRFYRDSAFIELVYYSFSAVGETWQTKSANHFMGSVPGTTNQGLQIGPNGSTQFKIAQWNNDGTWTATTANNTTYVWSGTNYSGASARFWQTGVDKGTQTKPNNTLQAATTTFYVGHGASSSYYFSGRLSELILWRAPLADTAMAIAYNNQIDFFGL